MPQNLTYHASEWESYEWHIKMHTKFLRASRKRVFHHLQRRQQTRSHFVTQTFQIVKRHEQSAMKDLVYSLIDVLHTQTFAENQIEDTREHAHSKIFRCHVQHQLSKEQGSWPWEEGQSVHCLQNRKMMVLSTCFLMVEHSFMDVDSTIQDKEYHCLTLEFTQQVELTSNTLEDVW